MTPTNIAARYGHAFVVASAQAVVSLRLALSLSLTLLCVNPLFAGNWIGGSDTWNQVNGAPWLSGVAPVAGEVINLTQNGGPYTIAYRAGTDSSSPVYGILTLGNTIDTTTLSVGGNGGNADEETLLTGAFHVNNGGRVELKTNGKIGPGPNFASVYVNAGAEVSHTGGTWSTLNGDLTVSSNNPSQLAHYVINGAGAVLSPRKTIVGQSQFGGATTGPAVFDLINGTVTNVGNGNAVEVGHASSGSGVLNISGGSISANTFNIYHTGTINLGNGQIIASNVGHHGGMIKQTAGQNTITFSLRVADTAGQTATYEMENGTITARELLVGANFGGGPITVGGTGTFIQNGGTITLSGNSNVPGLHISHVDAVESSIFVFRDATLQGNNNKFTVEKLGTFQGYGTVGITGAFTNNNRIIADGEGVDRELDMTALGMLTTAENTTNKGWFAVNQGKLTLRGVTLTPTVNWGEQASDSQIDMVNSAQLIYSDLTGSGTLNGSLLAVDRTDLPTAPLNTTFASIHEFSQTGSAAFSSYAIEIRFDDLQLPTGDEWIPVFYFNDGSGWQNVNGEFDFVNSLVYAEGFTSYGLFAVGATYVPEPSTMTLLGLALIPLARRRRRKA